MQADRSLVTQVRSEVDEVLCVLRELKNLRTDSRSLKSESSDVSEFPGLKPGIEGTDLSRSHLVELYPALCAGIIVSDEEIRCTLRDLLLDIGERYLFRRQTNV